MAVTVGILGDWILLLPSCADNDSMGVTNPMGMATYVQVYTENESENFLFLKVVEH
ncbi:MAG: hypothetical protein IPG90_21125 [Bacteroidetes bacterium]|nr:hypothetical protein [Bacteroidota bacterium]